MKQIVLICSNDIYVAKTYFTKFVLSNPINTPSLLDTTDLEKIIDISDQIYSIWKDNSTDTYYYYLLDSISNGMNFIYVPFAGLAHAYMYDKINHVSDNRYCIISLKERYNTQLVPMELYNLLLDSKFTRLSLDVINDILSAQTENNLISSDMNMIKEYLLDGKVKQLSELGEEMIPLLETIE
jgi:hypothetical protein